MSQSDKNSKLNSKSEHESNEENTDEDDFNCPICLGKLQYPVLLPCSHTLCYNCLVQFIQNQDPGLKNKCPTCQALFNISEIRNIQIGKSDGKDPRPKNYDQRFEREYAPPFQQQARLQFNINGFEFQIPIGRQGVQQQGQQVHRELTPREKIKKYFVTALFMLIFIVIIVSAVYDLYDDATRQPNAYHKIIFM